MQKKSEIAITSAINITQKTTLGEIRNKQILLKKIKDHDYFGLKDKNDINLLKENFLKMPQELLEKYYILLSLITVTTRYFIKTSHVHLNNLFNLKNHIIKNDNPSNSEISHYFSLFEKIFIDQSIKTIQHIEIHTLAFCKNKKLKHLIINVFHNIYKLKIFNTFPSELSLQKLTVLSHEEKKKIIQLEHTIQEILETPNLTRPIIYKLNNLYEELSYRQKLTIIDRNTIRSIKTINNEIIHIIYSLLQTNIKLVSNPLYIHSFIKHIKAMEDIKALELFLIYE